VRDGFRALLVALGLIWALMTLDKLGLVVAFAGGDPCRVRRDQPSRGLDDGRLGTADPLRRTHGM